MGQLIAFSAPRQAVFESYADRPLVENEVRLRTLFSGISAGTELAAYRGATPFLSKAWDAGRRLFVAGGPPDLTYPVRTLGYEQVGQVIETGTGTGDLPVGTIVFGTWGHRTEHIAPAEYARARLLPPGADPLTGIFSHIGAVALNGVHDGRIRIGDTVAVFGLGVPGQIVAQAARRSGARVIGIDLYESRRDKARALGTPVTLDPQQEKVAEKIKELTGGRGADVCFEVSGSPLALNEAIRSAAYSARVVVMGFFQGEARGLYLGEEFHHNRINLVCSQISGTDPELQYRWNKLRLAQTAIQLQAEGVLNLTTLITHIIPFAESLALFEKLDRAPEQVLQAVIQFPDA